MKRLLKRILFLSLLAGAGLVAFRMLSRRRKSSEPYSWSPAPPSAPAVQVEVHAPEPGREEVPAPVEGFVEAVDAPEAPELETGLRPPVAPEPPPPEPPVEWSPEPTEATVPPEEEAPATTDAPRVESEAVPTPEETEAAGEPDFLTDYFNKLADTADEDLVGRLAGLAEPDRELGPKAPEMPLAPPLPLEPATEPPSEAAEPMSSWEVPAAPASPPDPTQGPSELPESLEAALTEIAPMPIVPPPRRTAESYLDEGNVYFNVGQYKLAIERYSTAVEMDRELVAAYYNRANARTRSGDFEAALNDYDRALELQPFDADALNNRGMLHLYRANYADAVRDFNAALGIDPSDTTVIVNRGLARLHSGDAANALQDFREAVAVDGQDAAAHYGASQASAVLGNHDEAIRSVARALDLNPGYAREAAGDPSLASLQGDPAFLKLLRDSGAH